MTIVAVAGGTGNVGRTIVEALAASEKHEVKILARKPNPDLESQLGVPIIAVDYSDIAGLTKILEDNEIHTVISTITMFPLDGTQPQEIELIRAADASKTTKRFVSSDWGLPHKDEHVNQLGSVLHKRNAQAELKKVKDLETTIFLNGYFMDYWGIPVVKSHMTPLTFVLDIPHEIAAIPGTGNTPVVFTHTSDVAKYVVASLDLARWDTANYIIGDKVTWNEFVHLAEEAKGKKFQVTYDSVETLRKGQVTELPNQVPLYAFLPKQALQGLAATFGLWFEEGVFDIKPEKTLNGEFPDIKPWKVKALLDAAWSQN